ncbi:EAL domain-containing protein [Halomonas vilamensis]|uniref:EAL domain-containing protein n=1 Tax=Vreelandella vilamensis TaxID=531309 RepID=A0ABU1H8F2_9GAMM|nr:EAL domain-containing protein [Halomonas vilamensis]MDR5900111.1 EAL domain-containing protein [Halomonas vilamensis]
MNNVSPLREGQQGVYPFAERYPLLPERLDVISQWIEQLLPDSIVAFMRYDAKDGTLSLLPNPRFSLNYHKVLQQVEVASDVVSFATAAHDRCLTITEDIASDPRWDFFRDAALAEGVRACWSCPVIAPDGELLGTFSTYYAFPDVPTVGSQQRLHQAATMVSLALSYDRDSQRHHELTEWYRSLFTYHPDGVYELDLEGCFQRGNPALERITGYPESHLIGQHFEKFVTHDEREMTLVYFNMAALGEVVTYETRGIHAEGYAFYLEVINFPVSLDGEIVGVYGICRDITQRNRQTDALRRLSRGIEASPNGVVMADASEPGLPIVYANSAFLTMTGYSRDEVIGVNCRFLQGPDTDPETVDEIRAGIREQRDVCVTLVNYRKDGTPFWNQLEISPVFDDDQVCSHYIGTQQDITEWKTQKAHIAYQATHDLLTGLYNLTSFTSLLKDAFQRSLKTSELLAVMYLDMDGFKTINDGLGHHVGNQVLTTIAQRLETLLSPDEILARLGGDEFGILLADYHSRDQVIQLAERIIETLSQPIEVEGQQIQLSVSIGIACNCYLSAQSHELVQQADLAVEQAKRQGRNTWQWFKGCQTAHSRHSVMMRHELNTALLEEQLELHYQPQVDATNGGIRSVEALVRWRHPTRGMISPGEFIPLAEHTGQIIPLGRWILYQACRDIAELYANTGRRLPVAVNISSLQFRRDGFFEEVEHALACSGLPPALLELEVTESVLLDGAEPVVELMEKLNMMGISVALDDFGTGFSSLSYLCDLPARKLKLDRSFVQKAQQDHRIAAIVEGVITMAHHMEMVVVAEGVETREEQQDMVRRQCDLLQGFLFSRPIPLGDLMTLPVQLPADD